MKRTPLRRFASVFAPVTAISLSTWLFVDGFNKDSPSKSMSINTLDSTKLTTSEQPQIQNKDGLYGLEEALQVLATTDDNSRKVILESLPKVPQPTPITSSVDQLPSNSHENKNKSNKGQLNSYIYKNCGQRVKKHWNSFWTYPFCALFKSIEWQNS